MRQQAIEQHAKKRCCATTADRLVRYAILPLYRLPRRVHVAKPMLGGRHRIRTVAKIDRYGFREFSRSSRPPNVLTATPIAMAVVDISILCRLFQQLMS
jgi:hypothetical protein